MAVVLNSRPGLRLQTDTIARWLEVFLEPTQVTELRATWVRGKKIVSSFWRGDQLKDLAREAVQLEHDGAHGIYFTPNPLREDLLGSRRYAKDEDVLCRHWLLADVDPVRYGEDGQPLKDRKCPATEEEKQAAWTVLDRCRGALEAGGFCSPVVGDSGNGWHLCYAVNLPNDEPTREKIHNLLKGLKARCEDEFAEVDTSIANAARIWKLYGTLVRKGTATPERPYRWSRLIEVPGGFDRAR